MSKPLLQYTLEVLLEDKLIEEIVIVGHIQQILNRMKKFMAGIEKKIIYVDQNKLVDHLTLKLLNQFLYQMVIFLYANLHQLQHL